MRGRRLVDPGLAAAVGPPAQRLEAAVVAAGLPPRAFWRRLAESACGCDEPRRLVASALAETAGGNPALPALVERLVGPLVELDRALRQRLPRLAADLALRRAPLALQWEARGPGLMRGLASVTDGSWRLARADVYLVYPATGGGGAAHPQRNSVRLEAVLTNVSDTIPEVLRLGWLLAQVAAAQTPAPPQDASGRLAHLKLAPLALLPATLAAAEEVELAGCRAETIAAALALWEFAEPPPADAAGLLHDWWNDYRRRRRPWLAALAELARRLGSGC